MKDIFHKFWALLTPLEHRSFLFALTIMFFGMLFEMLGVGVILPVMALLTDENGAVSDYPIALRFREAFPGASMGLVLAVGLIGLYLVKNIFLTYQTWLQQRFIFGVQENLSYRLLEKYLKLPYTFHLRRNSAQLIRNTVNETVQYVFTVITPLMLVLTESIVVLGLLILLLVIEPVGTCAVGLLLGGVGVCYYLLTHRKSADLGETRVLHEGLRIQHVQQSLGGIKEVKLLGSEQNFLVAYQIHNRLAAHAARIQCVLVQLPRLMLEVVGVTAFGVLLGVMAWQGREVASMIPTLGLIAAAAFRLIPSANRIMGSINSLRYGKAIVDTLSAEMECENSLEGTLSNEGETLPAIQFRSHIEARNIAFSYVAAKEKALVDVSFQIEKNTSVGIIGKSGSGKSTLVDILLGLLEAQSGGIFVDGRNIRENRRSWQDQIGYVPQNIYLSDESLRDNVAFGLPVDRIDDGRVRKVLNAAHLDDLVKILPEGLDTLIGERGVRLSGGQRQRIGIARALYRNPQVLVFDEATSSLDSDSEERVMEAIRDLHGSRTVIIVAHRLSTIEHCDHLIRLEKGRIVQTGPTREVLDLPVSKID